MKARGSGTNEHMDLRKTPVRGIVEVMDDHHSRERSENLGSALQRLSVARERRGPVGVMDPFEVVSEAERHALIETPMAKRRRSIFRFSDRARDAVDE